MANTPEAITVNGRLYSHYSLRVQPTRNDGGTKPPAIAQHCKSVSWGASVAPVISRGQHPIALPRGDGGDASFSGQLVVTQEYLGRLLKTFSAPTIEGITDVDFTLELAYRPKGGELWVVKWQEASILSMPGGSQGGGEGLFRTLDFHVRYILEGPEGYERCIVRTDQDA